MNRWQKFLTLALAACFSIASIADPAVPSSIQTQALKQAHPKHHRQLRSVWPELISRFQLRNQYHLYAVQQQVAWWLNHREFLEHALARSTNYLAYFNQQTAIRHLPAELALLPAIESGYNPTASSNVGAMGLWQMMPQTATTNGLQINWWYDARRDTVASTQTALNYLSRLHYALKDWLLAVAAYDAGIGNIENAQARSGEKDFWRLDLPEETQDYVPRLLALAYLVEHASQYNLQLPAISDVPNFSVVVLYRQLDISEISRLAHIPETTIQALNPGMRRWATMPQGKFELVLPDYAARTFVRNANRVRLNSYVAWRYHRVYPGETMQSIAREYHVRSHLLYHVNRMSEASQPDEGQGVLVPV